MVERVQARTYAVPPAEQSIVLKPCADGHAEHRLIQVDDETTGQLELPRGSLLHLDMQRRPRNGDLVLAELVIRQRLTRTVRRYTSVEGIVSLAGLADRSGSIVRLRYEVGILGVVDGHVAPLNSPRDALLDGQQPDGS